MPQVRQLGARTWVGRLGGLVHPGAVAAGAARAVARLLSAGARAAGAACTVGFAVSRRATRLGPWRLSDCVAAHLSRALGCGGALEGRGSRPRRPSSAPPPVSQSDHAELRAIASGRSPRAQPRARTAGALRTSPPAGPVGDALADFYRVVEAAGGWPRPNRARRTPWTAAP